jgi:hypothetical protein
VVCVVPAVVSARVVAVGTVVARRMAVAAAGVVAMTSPAMRGP